MPDNLSDFPAYYEHKRLERSEQSAQIHREHKEKQKAAIAAQIEQSKKAHRRRLSEDLGLDLDKLTNRGDDAIAKTP